MKRPSIAILAATLLAGCSSPVTIKVTYAPTGKPADGILVQRRRPVNRWEKITNPVGATYHPHRVDETHWTDAAGMCTVKRIGAGDIMDLYTTSSVPLNVAAGEYQLKLAPGTTQSFSSYAYHVWLEDGRTRFTVSEPSWNWNKEKPNKMPGHVP